MTTHKLRFDAAQRAWDNRLPDDDDDGTCECTACKGNGTTPDPENPEGNEVECDTCEGSGQLTTDGEPFDPKAAERQEYDGGDEHAQY